MMSKEIESVIKTRPTTKSQGPHGFTGKFYKTSKEELTPFFLKFFQKTEKREHIQTHFVRGALS